VTVAAGFVCKDGIVLCADSQESAGDYKFPVDKLITGSDSWTDVAIAGSGLGPLVDTATERIARTASVITSKAANEYHLKTGQWETPGDAIVLPRQSLLRRV
jgi:hypothetical protein